MTNIWQRARRWCAGGATLAAAWALVACGGGGGGSDGGGTQPTSYTVAVSVSGAGSVATASGSINCGSSCSTAVNAGDSITLTATPASGQVLQAWGGACSGSASSCTLTIAQATSVSATFVAAGGGGTTRHALGVTVTGSGSVSSSPAGISCGATCSASFDKGTEVVLTATPASGQVLQAWGGACSGTGSSCTVTMSAAASVSAIFVAAPVASQAWGTPALLENNDDYNVADTNIFADAAVLSAIDADGNALVLWEQSDGTPNGSTKKVFSRYYVAGQGWSTAVAVPGMSGTGGQVTGALVFDANGTATWVRYNFRARRFSPSAGWASAEIAPTTIWGGLVSAKVDSTGQVHILAYGSGQLKSSRLPSGNSAWTNWSDVSAASATATVDARLALGAGNEAIAIWRERNPGDSYSSMMANRTASGVWKSPVRIESLLTNVNADSSPSLASDASGNAIAAWHQAKSLYLARFDAATLTWGTPVEMDAGLVNDTFSAGIELAMAPNGRATVVWQSSTFALKAASYVPASGWSAPEQVFSYSSEHFLGMDQTGRAWLVNRGVSQWPNPTDATQNLYARERAADGSWTTATLLETGAGEVKSGATCAGNLGGQAVCAWAQNDLANSTIRNSLWGVLRR